MLPHLVSSAVLVLQDSAAKSASQGYTDHLRMQTLLHALLVQQGTTRTALDRHLVCRAGWEGTRARNLSHRALIVLQTHMLACKHLRAVEAVHQGARQVPLHRSAQLVAQALCE